MCVGGIHTVAFPKISFSPKKKITFLTKNRRANVHVSRVALALQGALRLVCLHPRLKKVSARPPERGSRLHLGFPGKARGTFLEEGFC